MELSGVRESRTRQSLFIGGGVFLFLLCAELSLRFVAVSISVESALLAVVIALSVGVAAAASWYSKLVGETARAREEDGFSERLKRTLPEFESVAVLVICGGVLLILLDSLGIDVLENLTDDGVGAGNVLYIGAMTALSIAVERVREALEADGTTDDGDPGADSTEEIENGSETEEPREEIEFADVTGESAKSRTS